GRSRLRVARKMLAPQMQRSDMHARFDASAVTQDHGGPGVATSNPQDAFPVVGELVDAVRRAQQRVDRADQRGPEILRRLFPLTGVVGPTGRNYGAARHLRSGCSDCDSGGIVPTAALLSGFRPMPASGPA